MYTQGETFYYEIHEEEYELEVLENVVIGDTEYLVTEDFDGKIYVFSYDEDEEEVVYVSNKKHANEVIEYWKDEYLISADIGDYDDDEYYDRADIDIEEKYYVEDDDDLY